MIVDRLAAAVAILRVVRLAIRESFRSSSSSAMHTWPPSTLRFMNCLWEGSAAVDPVVVNTGVSVLCIIAVAIPAVGGSVDDDSSGTVALDVLEVVVSGGDSTLAGVIDVVVPAICILSPCRTVGTSSF